METLRVERERGREGEWHKIPGRSRMIKADVSRLICPFIGVPNYESFEREDSSYLVSIAPDIDPNRAADSPISSGQTGETGAAALDSWGTAIFETIDRNEHLRSFVRGN